MEFNDHTNYPDKFILRSIEIGLPRYTRDVVNQLISGLRGKRVSSHNQTSRANSILDFGAGSGTLTDLVYEECTIKPDCIEIDNELVGVLEQKGYRTFNSLKNLTQKYDWIYSSNVLEHIDDDQETLKDMYSALNAEGMLAIYVPAFQILFSSFDTSVGHFRRYSKTEIERKLSRSGFKIIESRYNDSIGFFIALIAKVLWTRNHSILKLGSIFSFYDKFVYPLSRKIDRLGLQYFVGKNLLIIATKLPRN